MSGPRPETRYIPHEPNPYAPMCKEHVYVIRVGDKGPVKIGVAVDPVRRMRALQTAHHEPLRLLVVFEHGGRPLEGKLHEWFASSRLRGEWFELSDELKEYLASRIRDAGLLPPPSWPPLRELRRRVDEGPMPVPVIARRLDPMEYLSYDDGALTAQGVAHYTNLSSGVLDRAGAYDAIPHEEREYGPAYMPADVDEWMYRR